MAKVTVSSDGYLKQQITAGKHKLIADEPAAVGGSDSGADPYSFLLAALGACTSMTLQMYAKRKGWPLEKVDIHLSHGRVYADDCEDCQTKEGKVDRIDRRITLTGPLTDEQRARLMEIARLCPVHKTLSSEISIKDS